MQNKVLLNSHLFQKQCSLKKTRASLGELRELFVSICIMHFRPLLGSVDNVNQEYILHPLCNTPDNVMQPLYSLSAPRMSHFASHKQTSEISRILGTVHRIELLNGTGTRATLRNFWDTQTYCTYRYTQRFCDSQDYHLKLWSVHQLAQEGTILIVIVLYVCHIQYAWFPIRLLTHWYFSRIEIEAKPEMESDKKLDKLEIFLGRLNSKGKRFHYQLQYIQNTLH